MKKIIVLGSGLVGSVMANDLAKNYEVTSVDISTKNLEKIQSEKINKLCADVSEKDVLENLIKNFDLVVGALPGFMGYNIMKRVIEAKAKSLGVTEDSLQKDYESMTSLKTFVNKEDIANMAVFLLSQEAHKISGQVMTIDGNTERMN